MRHTRGTYTAIIFVEQRQRRLRNICKVGQRPPGWFQEPSNIWLRVLWYDMILRLRLVRYEITRRGYIIRREERKRKLTTPIREPSPSRLIQQLCPWLVILAFRLCNRFGGIWQWTMAMSNIMRFPTQAICVENQNVHEYVQVGELQCW